MHDEKFISNCKDESELQYMYTRNTTLIWFHPTPKKSWVLMFIPYGNFGTPLVKQYGFGMEHVLGSHIPFWNSP